MPVYDGEIIDLQDRDGTVGMTGGGILFAAGNERMARPFRVTPAGLVIDTQSVDTLLVRINQQLRIIRDSL